MSSDLGHRIRLAIRIRTPALIGPSHQILGAMHTPSIYSIGHSNLTLDRLLDSLHWARIQTLVDVRARPGSRRHPHFSSKLLRPAIENAGVHYRWAGKELGGLRPTHAGSIHPSLPDGLQGYADYMETEAFGAAADQLVACAAHGRLALMCAERLPQHCHRSLIADYLTLQGIKVVHLTGPGQIQTHCLRASLRCDSGRLVYDRNYQHTLGNF